MPRAQHDELLERARRRNQTLSDYLKDLIDRDLGEPARDMGMDELRKLGTLARFDFTSTIRELRDPESR